MTSTQLPPLTFSDGGGFRISLFSPPTDGLATLVPAASHDPVFSDAKDPDSHDGREASRAEPKAKTESSPNEAETEETQRKTESKEQEEPQLAEVLQQEPEQGQDLHNEGRQEQPAHQHHEQVQEPKQKGPPEEEQERTRQPQPHPQQPEPTVELEVKPEIQMQHEPAARLDPTPEHSHDQDDGEQVEDRESVSTDLPAAPSIPTHPVQSMQQAFVESLEEVTKGGESAKPKLRQLNAKRRRERLLEQGKDDTPYDATWRYRPGQKQHEVFKLVSQISFGVYLLLNSLANNNTQVVTILQGHIDEVDEFLEVLLEDLAAATGDLRERVDNLKVPMANMRTFEELLEDRDFRAEILDGNENIEYILARTNAMLTQLGDDVEKGLTSSLTFQAWLRSLGTESHFRETPELSDIYDAMQGNAEGWLNAFDEIKKRSGTVRVLMAELSNIVTEVEQTIGQVSRRTWAAVQPYSSPKQRSIDGSSTRSPPSMRSIPRNTGRVSIRSGSVAHTPGPLTSESRDDGLEYFTLPGAAPLLPPMMPPSRSAARPRVSVTPEVGKLHVDTALRSHPPSTEEEPEGYEPDGQREEVDTSPLYILQPRTYTPQPPEPLPSPMLRDSPVITSQRQSQMHSANAFSPNTASIRHRVSLRTAPPKAIHIPPRNIAEASGQRPASSHQTPRTANSMARESAYGSEFGTPPSRHVSRVASMAEMQPPAPQSGMGSPRSDHQYYRPVRASPHSPLQQRPHTSVGNPPPRPSTAYRPNHVRNQPSRLGGMSTLSRVTMATPDDQMRPPSGFMTQGGDKHLKKKKSAFGWFKKAFSLDEEEKATFEARKTMQSNERYFDSRSPKFLDGKRLR